MIGLGNLIFIVDINHERTNVNIRNDFRMMFQRCGTQSYLWLGQCNAHALSYHDHCTFQQTLISNPTDHDTENTHDTLYNKVVLLDK